MVLSRALSLAAVMLLVGCSVVGRAEAQENLEAGKSPSQIFANTCTACHKSPRGLLKTVAPGSLQGFLRQHYTTSPEMAGVLASYLMSNGATDTRYGDKPKGGRDAKSAPRPARSDAGAVDGEPEHAVRSTRRRPAEPAEAGNPAAEGEQAVTEHGPEGRKTKRRLGKRGKPGVEEGAPEGSSSAAEPANEEPTASEAARSDTARVEPTKPEIVKPEALKPEPVRSEPARLQESARPAESVAPVESAKPAQRANTESAKVKMNEAKVNEPKVNEALPPSLRPDPVPAVTPASPSGGGTSQD